MLQSLAGLSISANSEQAFTAHFMKISTSRQDALVFDDRFRVTLAGKIIRPQIWRAILELAKKRTIELVLDRR